VADDMGVRGEMTEGQRQPGSGETAVFGLTPEQLRPMVENVAGERVRSFDVSIEHEVAVQHYGGRGDKVVPTFTYETRSGRVGRAAVFVKRHCNPGPNEALHYEWLTKHSAPIPRIYGALSGPDVHDIIFIEYIDPFVGDEESFLRDPEQFPRFLCATARFNAIEPCAQYAAELPCKLQYLGSDEWPGLLERVWGHAARGELGGDLLRLCSAGVRKQVVGLMDGLPASLADMATGLSHWDHRPNNIGWRRQTGEMVIFDLEDTMMAPRFEDVADWLGAPDGAQPRCRPREELAEHYLRERERYGGGPVRLEEFVGEVALLWRAHVLRGLSWWLGYGGVLEGCDAPPGEDADARREANRRKLHRELSSLVG
jgi:hypothetical protein